MYSPSTLFAALFGFNGLVIHIEGIAFLQNADHGLSGVQPDFVAVVIIISGSAVVRGFFPCDMNSLAIGKEPSVSCIVVALERQISLIISCLVVGALNQDVLECKLFIICKVNVGTVAVAAQVLVSVIQSGGLVVNEIAVGHRISGGHIYLGGGNRVTVLLQGVGR